MTQPQSDSERACLARLQEMDAALARMEQELPDDVRAVGAEARKRVAVWMDRVAAGGSDLNLLTEAMREISGMMDGILTVKGSLVLRGSGQVIGEARCRRLQVEDGGQLSGKISMITDGAPATPVPATASPGPSCWG